MKNNALKNVTDLLLDMENINMSKSMCLAEKIQARGVIGMRIIKLVAELEDEITKLRAELKQED